MGKSWVSLGGFPVQANKIEEHEIKPNEQAGFKTIWYVHEDYRIEKGSAFADHPYPHPNEGVLMPSGKVHRVYAPILHGEITSEIAKLRSGDKSAILKFARSYGGFGHQAWTGEIQDKCRYGFLSWDGGDPLPWIVAHAHTIFLCLSLIEALEQGDPDKIKSVLQKVHEGGSASVLITTIAIRGEIIENNWIYDWEDWIAIAKDMVLSMINKNISDIKMQLADSGEGPWPYLHFSALIQVAYWHLAKNMRGPIRRCEAQNCGAFFMQTEPRQRFCPKSIRGRESACAIRERVKKSRQNRHSENNQTRDLGGID